MWILYKEMFDIIPKCILLLYLFVNVFRLPRKCRDNIINCVIFACKTLSKKGISLLRKINIWLLHLSNNVTKKRNLTKVTFYWKECPSFFSHASLDLSCVTWNVMFFLLDLENSRLNALRCAVKSDDAVTQAQHRHGNSYRKLLNKRISINNF